jgi:hypothetical protein
MACAGPAIIGNIVEEMDALPLIDGLRVEWDAPQSHL